MQTIGERVAHYREEKGISQATLAALAGVSQATISRLEASDAGEIRLLAKISKVLQQPLAELLPPEYMANRMTADEQFDGGIGQFAAFCPNPFCDSNATDLNEDGEACVHWKSSRTYATEDFDEVNFCLRCGTELLKECPSCKKRFANANTRFCVVCGSQVCNRPTAEECERIRNQLPPSCPF